MVYATSELKIRLGIEPSLILPRERLLRFAHQHSSCLQRNEANDTVQMTYPTIRYRANIIQVISRSIKKNSDSCIKTFAFWGYAIFYIYTTNSISIYSAHNHSPINLMSSGLMSRWLSYIILALEGGWSVFWQNTRILVLDNSILFSPTLREISNLLLYLLVYTVKFPFFLRSIPLNTFGKLEIKLIPESFTSMNKRY